MQCIYWCKKQGSVVTGSSAVVCMLWCKEIAVYILVKTQCSECTCVTTEIVFNGVTTMLYIYWRKYSTGFVLV